MTSAKQRIFGFSCALLMASPAFAQGLQYNCIFDKRVDGQEVAAQSGTFVLLDHDLRLEINRVLAEVRYVVGGLQVVIRPRDVTQAASSVYIPAPVRASFRHEFQPNQSDAIRFGIACNQID